MPRSNGKIYIDTTVTPHLGIEFISDLAATLGVNSGALGYIITHGDINPWAMFKATRDGSKKMINRPDFDPNSSTIEALGFYNASGVAGPVYATTVQGLIDLYGDTALLKGDPANGWRYLRPRGYSYNEMFRPFDFARIIGMAVVAGFGYNSNAENPFGTFHCTQNLTRHGGVLSADVAKTLPAGDVDDTMIVIGSFNARLANTQKMWYFGILLVPPASDLSCKLIGNVSTKITDGVSYRGHEELEFEAGFTLSDSSFAVGVYTAYPFLTNQPLPSGMIQNVTNRNATLADGRRLYSLPGCVPLSVNIFDFLIAITVEATRATAVGGNYETNVYYTIKNNYTTPITISNLMLKWRSGNTYSAARQPGEVFYSKSNRWDDGNPSGTADNTYASPLADVTLAAGEEKRIPGAGLSFVATLPSADENTLFIGANVNGVDMYGSTTIMVPVVPGGGGLVINP